MKKLDFYYRTINAIEAVFKDISLASNDFERALINFFILKSQTFRGFVDDNKKIKINEVAFYLKEERISNKMAFRVFLKVMLHWLFLLYAMCRKAVFAKRYENIIKSYVEVEYNLFKSEIKNSEHLVLVFPFPLSIKRQLKYLKSLKKNSSKENVNFSLYGMPYSVNKLCHLLIKRNLMSVFELEYNASIRYSKMLSKIEFNTLMNMDDFEPLSAVYHSIIQSNGYTVMTYLHGIGTYAPFIATDYLKTFNKLQQCYYTKFTNIPNLSVYKDYISEYSHEQQNKKLDLIVFYSQIMESTLDLQSVEKRVVNRVQEIAKEKGIKLMYKKHPNFLGNLPCYLSDVEQYTSAGQNLFCNMTTVGLSLYSTSYYTEKHDYSVLVEVPEIPVRLLFSEDHLIVDEHRLQGLLKGKI